MHFRWLLKIYTWHRGAILVDIEISIFLYYSWTIRIRSIKRFQFIRIKDLIISYENQLVINKVKLIFLFIWFESH